MPTAIESSGSVKFDDQTYLISYFYEIGDLLENKDFQYCHKLNNNTELPISQMISIFNGTSDLSSFLELKTHQYSALIPRIKLFRVEYDESGKQLSDKEFIFEKDYKYKLNDIFKPVIRENGGIKRINWRLAGTNPVTAEKQVEVELEFYFDSINSFSGGNFDDMRNAWTATDKGYDPEIFKPQFDTDTTTKNYWSLLFHPKIEKSEMVEVSRERYNSKFFRIRANVGWEEVEPNIKNQLFPSMDINEEIKKLNHSFILNLIQHKFSFNEDGSLVVTANYIATFENATHNYDFNLLGELKRVLSDMKSQGIGSLFEQTLRLEKEGDPAGTLTQVEQQETLTILATRAGLSGLTPEEILNSLNLGDLTEQEKNDFTQKIYNLSINDINEISDVLNNSDKVNCLFKENDVTLNITDIERSKGILGVSTQLPKEQKDLFSSVFGENLETLTEKATKIIERASKRQRQSYYKKLFDKLIDSNNIRTIRVTKDQKEAWERWVSNNGTGQKPEFGGFSSTNGNLILEKEEGEIFKQNKGTDSSTSDEASKSLKERGVLFDKDKKYISFITLGNIIESAYQIIDESLTGVSNISAKEDLKRQIILCGNISNDTKILSISSTEEQKNNNTNNLLDIPIDLKMLKLFLIENVVKPQRDTYSLFLFIKDMITKLVVGVLNGTNLYNSQTEVFSDTSLATTIFNLGDNNKNNDPFALGLLNSINSNNVNELKNEIKNYYINNINNHSNYYNYFLIYDKKFIDFYPNTNIELDKNMGIYHYTVGEEVGLLKSANFSRIDTPYLKEAKAVGKETFYLGQFRDRYNVDLTMVGNNIYYPGMMLYILPSAEATQQPSTISPNFSQITGIGGYYFVEKVESTISEELYETKLSCIWQYDGSEKKPETIQGKEKCDVIFSKTNTLDLFSSLITKTENQAKINKDNQVIAEKLKDVAVSALAGVASASGLPFIGPVIITIANEFFGNESDSE